MCFGGKTNIEAPKAPVVEQAPIPAPLPSPTPTKVEAQGTAAVRRRLTRRIKAGFQSTIKTSAQGITGKGAGLTNTDKKTTLGA